MKPRQRAIINVLRTKHREDEVFVGAEIGVHEGCTSRELLRAFSQLRLFMIDPWKAPGPDSTYLLGGDPDAKADQAEFDRRMQRAVEKTDFANERRRIITTDSLHAVRLLADCVLDFGFVDGNHDKQAVKGDARAYWPLIAEGGFMFFHDYENTGPWTIEVKAAVDEFAAEIGREVVRDEEFVAHIVK